MRTPDSHTPSFTTMTHARLRALQGDFDAAADLLRQLLNLQPDHDEARALLRTIAGKTPRAARVRRLKDWLSRIRRWS